MEVLPIARTTHSGVSVGLSYQVLSVQLVNNKPTVTINHGGMPKMYYLPEGYHNWVSNCASTVRYGVKLFPRIVSFGLINQEPYVFMKPFNSVTV